MAARGQQNRQPAKPAAKKPAPKASSGGGVNAGPTPGTYRYKGSTYGRPGTAGGRNTSGGPGRAPSRSGPSRVAGATRSTSGAAQRKLPEDSMYSWMKPKGEQRYLRSQSPRPVAVNKRSPIAGRGSPAGTGTGELRTRGDNYTNYGVRVARPRRRKSG